MRVSFVLKESIYDCKIQITDMQGCRHYLIPALTDNNMSNQHITVDIYGNEFNLTLIPLMPDMNSALNELEENSWKDRFAKKTTKLLASSLDKMVLRVGCTYHVSDLQDGNRLDIALQNYTFGTFDRFDLLELIPAMYMFFEVSKPEKRLRLINAYETNRKDVVKAARMLALADGFGNGFFLTLFTYPIQVSRIKHLTKNRKILKILTKFNEFSDLQRQQFLEKQERFFDR